LLITRKRSAQAVGSGVKERRAVARCHGRTRCLYGSQRLEGRRITPPSAPPGTTCPQRWSVLWTARQPSTPASWGPTRATDKAGQFIDLEEQEQRQRQEP